MRGVLEGFGVIGIVIALGLVLAHVGVLTADSQLLLSRLVFFVATPSLLFQLLARADVAGVFSGNLAVSALSVALTASVYLLLARTIWRRKVPDLVVGALCSSYVNAGNLGLPIAVYVLGDGSYIVPLLLLQLLVITPIAFSVLDTTTSGRQHQSVARIATQPLRNPVTVGSLLGLAVALTGWRVPAVVGDPVALVSGMAVPGALLAYGVSLRLGPRPIAGGAATEVAVVAALKLVFQPAAAYLLARWVFGLHGTALLAATVTAALPTAQNIFVYATRYGRATILARDAIFVTTVLSVPVLLVVAALLT